MKPQMDIIRNDVHMSLRILIHVQRRWGHLDSKWLHWKAMDVLADPDMLCSQQQKNIETKLDMKSPRLFTCLQPFTRFTFTIPLLATESSSLLLWVSQ